ncbi:hypothetical protein Taro_039600 [Colocasia esculenta]|uniref:Uncharacterized protein n=1 Tax=Colocasia esculenta TaxID=4460 RepID=A0A843WW69_COLES|nr:hypothetical protein [Colocasia esculenta]
MCSSAASVYVCHPSQTLIYAAAPTPSAYNPSLSHSVELDPSLVPYHVRRVSRLPPQRMRPDRSFPITETKASSTEMGVLPLSLSSEGVDS